MNNYALNSDALTRDLARKVGASMPSTEHDPLLFKVDPPATPDPRTVSTGDEPAGSVRDRMLAALAASHPAAEPDVDPLVAALKRKTARPAR